MHGSEEEGLPEECQLGSQANQLQVRGQVGDQESRRSGAGGPFGRPFRTVADTSSLDVITTCIFIMRNMLQNCCMQSFIVIKVFSQNYLLEVNK